MKLLIVSDSHGEYDNLIKLFESHKGYLIIHCGDYCINEKLLNDYNVIYVKGNCDLSRAESERIFSVDSKKILLTHGHKYHVKSTLTNIYYKALEENCNYVLFGHTHRYFNFVEDGIHFINPGSFRDTGNYVEIIDDEVFLKRM